MNKKPLNIFFILEKIGPYHNARFNYLTNNKELIINVIETNSISKTYLWNNKFHSKYNIFKLDKKSKNRLKPNELALQLNQLLYKKHPDIIFITGWYERVHHYLLYKSFQNRIPLVLLSDSRFSDEKRFFFKEYIKRLLIKGFSSAIVAGVESRNYLVKLHFRNGSIFTPYNVIDNNFFLKFKDTKKIPFSNYFLCVARFVKKKNHKTLIHAFEIYKKNNGKLNLLMIGFGPEENTIKKEINKSNFKKSIFIDAWKQINELPLYYKNSRAVILPSFTDQWGLVVNEAMACGKPCLVSKNCGCYLDLIDNSKTGWGFDSNNPIELASLLHKVESLNEIEVNELENNVKNKISKYDLDNFALAVDKSISKALTNRRFSLISSITSYFLFRISFIK